jgi:RNA polymerase sigma factor for flagellar operon FliA
MNDLTMPSGFVSSTPAPKLVVPGGRGPQRRSWRPRLANGESKEPTDAPETSEISDAKRISSLTRLAGEPVSESDVSSSDTAPCTETIIGIVPGSEHDRLWKAYYANPGDERRNDLVEAYHGFAEAVTRRFSTRLPRSVDRGDLATAGSVGLMHAVVGFKPERGVRFESYCELRVKGALLDELRTQDWLPRPWRQRMEQQKRTIEALRAREVREPTDAEIALEMGLELDLYQQLFGIGLPGAPSGCMGTSGAEDDVTQVLEVVPDPSVMDPAEGLTQAELVSLVTQRLTEQEYRILYLRYWEGISMREIGEMTQLSESRVRKIHTRLIELLQERLQVNMIDE